MAKVIIEIKNTVSGIKGRNLRTSIAVDGSAELDGDEGTLAGMVALLVLNKSQKIINESAHEAIEILKTMVSSPVVVSLKWLLKNMSLKGTLTMNVKIRNEIQALIRIQERNNNGGELREFICAREVDGYGEKTYLITFDHYSICARYCGESISRAIASGDAFNVDLWEYVMDREYICASDPEAREMWQRIWRDYRLMAKGWARCCYSSLALKAVQLSLRHIPASLREPLLY